MPANVGQRDVTAVTDTRLAVTIGGDNLMFSEWKNVSISMDIEQASDSFSFSVGPLIKVNNTIKDDRVSQLTPGRIVRLLRGSTCIMRGVIETQTIKSTGTEESLEISGRDIMSVLVDSSVGANLRVAGQTLEQVAKKIVKPFASDPGKVKSYDKLLKQGSTGDDVIAAQQVLKNNGLYQDGEVDGIFGPKTHRAVVEYQRRFDLKVDGIIGPETGGHMFQGSVAVSSEAPFQEPLVVVDIRDGDKKAEVTSKKYEDKAKGPSDSDKCESFLRGLVEKKNLDMWVNPEGQLVIGDREAARDAATPKMHLYTYRDQNESWRNNFKDVQVVRTIAERFSEYRIFGRYRDQMKNKTESISEIRKDESVPIHKPMYIKIDDAKSKEDFKNKADAAVDAGKAAAYQVSGTAAGYGLKVGDERHYFDINGLVEVTNEVAGMTNLLFYVSKATFSCDASAGPQTAITLKMMVRDNEDSLASKVSSAFPFGK